MKNLVQFTINVRKSHRQHQCTLHLMCEYSNCARFKQLYLGNHSILHTCSYELSFSQWPIPSPPPFSWITLYKAKQNVTTAKAHTFVSAYKKILIKTLLWFSYSTVKVRVAAKSEGLGWDVRGVGWGDRKSGEEACKGNGEELVSGRSSVRTWDIRIVATARNSMRFCADFKQETQNLSTCYMRKC
jgi:hypothetical protein